MERVKIGSGSAGVVSRFSFSALRRVPSAVAIAVASTLSLAATGPAAACPKLGRGVNVLSTDGMFSPPYHSDFRFSYFDDLKRFGFDNVRVNLVALPHLVDGVVEERWLTTVRGVVEHARASGLKVVLDVHDFRFCQKSPDECLAGLRVLWPRLSEYFATFDDGVFFELLNEPGGHMDPDEWRRFVVEEIPVIREKNPDRCILVGTTSDDVETEFALLRTHAGDAKYKNLIIDFHYYRPYSFTHQGAPWSPRVRDHSEEWSETNGAGALATDMGRLQTALDGLKPFAFADVYIGEFGVYDRAPARSRLCYLTSLVAELRKRNYSWAYWQLSSDFAILDEKTAVWDEERIGVLTGRTNVKCGE